jgi:hypothetical protein
MKMKEVMPVTKTETQILTARLQLAASAPTAERQQIPGYVRGKSWAVNEASWLDIERVAKWSRDDDDYLCHLVLIGLTFGGNDAPRGFSIDFLQAVGDVYVALLNTIWGISSGPAVEK